MSCINIVALIIVLIIGITGIIMLGLIGEMMGSINEDRKDKP